MWRYAVAMLVACLITSEASSGSSGRARSRLVGRLQNMEVCRDRPSAIRNLTASLRSLKDGTVAIDTEFFVTKTAKSFSKMELIIVKCREAVSTNSCEYYQTWTYTLGVCAAINAPGMPWSTSMDKTEPKFKCPFLKGPYKTINATANIDPLTKLPFPWEGNVWRTTISFINELKEVHLCWTVDMVFVRVKTN